MTPSNIRRFQDLYKFAVELKFEGPNATEILRECLELAQFLVEKNAAYGDSAITPLRVISKSDPAEQIRVRMDDKLSRLVRGHAVGEDALKDLVGYWILLKTCERRIAQDKAEDNEP